MQSPRKDKAADSNVLVAFALKRTYSTYVSYLLLKEGSLAGPLTTDSPTSTRLG